MLRFPDRFWWVQRYSGIVSAVGCLIATIYCVIKAYDVYSLAQIPVSDGNLQALLRLDAQQFLLLGGQFALFAAMSGIFIRDSFSAEKRSHCRRLAMQGDQEAMARATIEVDRRNVSDLASEPLELMWQATAFSGRIMTVVITIIIVIFGPCAALFWYLAYCLATNTPPIGSISIEEVSPLERVGGVCRYGGYGD